MFHNWLRFTYARLVRLDVQRHIDSGATLWYNFAIAQWESMQCFSCLRLNGAQQLTSGCWTTVFLFDIYTSG